MKKYTERRLRKFAPHLLDKENSPYKTKAVSLD